MHDIEPYYKWRDYYIASEDSRSPFFNRRYNEFQFTNKIYNYYVHPQWDFYGSNTLAMKILYVDYDLQFTFIELLGEWNDCITNDIMILKREIIDRLMDQNIIKYALFCDNVLNFHSCDDEYYAEWYEDINEVDGWTCLINCQEHVSHEIKEARLYQYMKCGTLFENINWRCKSPKSVFVELDNLCND